MSKTELAELIAEFIMCAQDTILEAFEKDDISIIQDEVYEYLNNCDQD